MAYAAWLPVMTAIVLGGACIAIAWGISALNRRAERGAPRSRAALAATLFFFVLAAVFFLDAATVDHPVPALATALRALAALAAVVTAVLLRAAVGDHRAPVAPPVSPPVSDEAIAAPAPAPPSERAAPPPDDVGRADTPSSTDLPAAPQATPETGFLGLVSHELRTPLTAMHLLLDRLDGAGDEIPPRHRKTIERLTSTAIRLTDLVDSLLYYARIRSGRFVSSTEPFDLSTVARDAAEELRPQAERKALVLQAARSAERISIESDPKLIRLVIVNLVSNAVKFTDRGEVAVTVSAEGDSRVVRVTDSGAGIPAAEQKRIFEPFQNLAPTRHKHLPGVGLGLSLARQIVDNLGGRIAVQSEPGRGSTFEVFLPAVTRPRTAPTSVAR
jgi:signal transduction histidine kinase